MFRTLTDVFGVNTSASADFKTQLTGEIPECLTVASQELA